MRTLERFQTGLRIGRPLRMGLGLGLLALLVWFVPTAWSAEVAGWRCGLARVKITPEKLFWMGGFAFRTRPAEGTLDDLWVKVLALEAPEGGKALLITADLVGVPKWLYDRWSAEIARKHGLDRGRVRISASHTHSGPVLTDALQDIYPLDAVQRGLIEEYSRWLERAVLETVDRAMATSAPVTIWSGQGEATFAFNRRTNNESERAKMIERGESAKGPSDFAVPVLALKGSDGALRAVVFGYAAHTSALTFNFRWSADYAGVTQRELEKRYPGAVAMYFQGCGSDQSAVPRGSVEQCQAIGETLARSVDVVLGRPMRPVEPLFRSAFEFVSLDYGEQPAAEALAELGKGTEHVDYKARWARRLAAELKAGRVFERGYPEYPVQVWRLGREQLWIALGGEVCVDYALRFKRQYGAETWVAGYSNDVMAYIPSRRLWEEGGYQAGAFEVYGLPANRWCPDIEDRIAGAVERGVRKVRGGGL